MAFSEDFLDWTKPEWVDYPDEIEHLYTNQIAPYGRAPHILLGFPKRFMPSRKAVEEIKKAGVSDIVLMTSRDGRRFRRWREAFLRPGLQRERWVHRNNMVAWGLVATKPSTPGAIDELSLYSMEGSGHGDLCRMRRFTVRLDGFVSIQAPLAGGELLTKLLAFDGRRMVINFSTSAAGSIRVEIQDAQGQPIPGYTLADCPEIYGDRIEQVLAWKEDQDVGQLAGKPVRLRFVLKDADLYAVQFAQ